ncbi:MAG: hypothetical protein R3E66_17485 [bacterium]
MKHVILSALALLVACGDGLESVDVRGQELVFGPRDALQTRTGIKSPQLSIDPNLQGTFQAGEHADETLMRLAQNPFYTTPLGHRSGPRELLEFLAELYAYPEAVTTLALNYYGVPQASAKPFAEFLERYKDIEMLEHNLLNARNLDPAKAAIVAKVFPQET